MRMASSLCVFCFALLVAPTVADDRGADANAPIAYRGARIYTASGPVIERGVLVVHAGKIVAVGSEDDVTVPSNAKVLDLKGKTIIPGLVDTHSHVGVYSRPQVPANADGNEGSGAVQSGIRALDAIYPDDPGIRMAVAGGVTTANIMPGSGNVIGGQTSYVKYRGKTIEDMLIPNMPVLGGLKMANGENPKSFNFGRNKKAPSTRMKLAAMQREQFIKAREYQRQWEDYRKKAAAGKEATPPETDLSLQPLVEVLERKRTVHFHCHRADDLMSAVRLAEEFHFELVLQHGSEGYRVAEELAQRKIPVSLTLLDSPGGKVEAAGLIEETAAYLTKAGVKVAINTDDSITESRFFLRTGATAIRGGLSEDDALRALTIHGAQMLHLEDRLGSLEKGKDADFVVLSGPPFSIYTQVLETYIDGVRIFNRAERKDWAYQTGGFALLREDRLPSTPSAVQPQSVVQSPAAPAKTPPMTEAPRRFAIYAGQIHTVSQGTLRDGVVLIEDGKIRSVGPRAQFVLPPDTPVITAAVVTPGLIDAHAVVGLSGAFNLRADQDQDEQSDPNQADLRTLDGFNPQESLLEFLRQQGTTIVHALPGRANVIAGQSGIFRTLGTTVEQATIRCPAGLLVNLGEVPKQTYPHRLPTTRMGTASLVRAALAQAQNDARKRAAAKDDSKLPPRNLKLEALQMALDGKIPVIFSAHRADDIATALRLAREFKLRAWIDLATEGYLMADTLAAAKVPVIVHPTMQRIGDMETYHSHLGNAGVLAKANIPLAFGTAYESYVPKTRVLRYEAAMAMVNGLGFDATLRAITLDAARILGIEDRYGSIEAGKVADIVLYDGDPFEHTTHVTHTIMSGRVAFNRADYLRLPLARRALPLASGDGVGCCLGW